MEGVKRKGREGSLKETEGNKEKNGGTNETMKGLKEGEKQISIRKD